MARVAVCEDDPGIRRVVTQAMARAGHETVVAFNGREAIKLFAQDSAIDVIVMDIGLPDSDGRDVCQALRATGQAAPVLFLTALGSVPDRLAGYRAGADDYVAKPFDVLELTARVGVLARRGRADQPEPPTDLVLDEARHSLVCHGREVLLTPTEFRMLAPLYVRRGEVVRRQAVISAAWPDGDTLAENTIDSYVRRLRIKLREVDSPYELHTVRGVGYRLQ